MGDEIIDPEKGQTESTYLWYRDHPTHENLDALLTALTTHARAIIWNEMRARRPDIENECLMRAVRGMSRFRGDSKFSTWFHTIVRNRCRTTGRREARRREVALEEAIRVKAPSLGVFEAQELIETLSPKELEVWRARMEQGLSFTQIAVLQDTTESTVRSRLFRVRQKLADLMTHS